MKKYFFIAIAAIAFAGCYTDNKEELYPDNNTGGGGGNACDTSGMSFATDIQPILNTNCALSGCHKTGSATGGYILDTYAGVNATVSSGRLLGSINHETGYSPMPKNSSKLASCDINKITAWVNAGALNN